MFDRIENKISSLSSFYNSAQKDAENVRDNLLKKKYFFFEENKNLIKVNNSIESLTVGGADSGFYSDALTGLDYVYTKTAGSYLEYKDGKIKNYSRIPKVAKVDLHLASSILQKDEIHKFSSIKRISEELDNLKLILDTKNPDFLIMDGPVLPQPVDRPQNKSPLYEDYKKMLGKFVNIYDKCKSNNTVFIGSVEDSRATTFMDLISNTNSRLNDTLFLDLILNEKEALSFFKIFDTKSNIINQDLEEFGEYKFFASYMKLNSDYPLRVETTSNKYSKIRDALSFIASSYRDYAYPSVIIDADKRAKLTGSEIKTIKSIVDRGFTKMKIKKLRRDRRY